MLEHCSRFALARWLAKLALCAFVLVCSSRAAALDAEDVPEPLRPWLPWVLEQLGDSVCPELPEGPVCAWPGRLELELSESGGRFRLAVSLDRRARVVLPGGDKQWPQEVLVDGRAAVVLEGGAAPVVTLDAGQHALEGRFAWRRLPETLLVPSSVALLQLSVNGQRVALPRRDGERVWLKGSASPVEEVESLTVEVFRKLDDQLPLLVQTQLVLEVSGKSRELRLSTALLPGSIAFGLASKLPARIEPSGELLLQVYPGRHELTIDALYPSSPERLSAPRHAPPGPAHEIWVFVPRSEYRQTEIEGGSSVDPERTNLPVAWRGFAAYQLAAGDELVLKTLRRAQPQAPPNRLSLERQLWLDLDGQGYTVKDRLSGEIKRTWRLDLREGELGHAALGGVDQLITTHPTSGTRGVELRQSALELSAESRLEQARGELPAVAWSENVEHLGMELNLPPGWQLFGVGGADSVSESWLSRWDLFAVFFVLVVAVAVAKLDRPLWGVLALLALVVGHGEAHAPRFIWALVLLAIALLKGLPAGRFRQVVRAFGLVASVVLLGSSVSFGVSQIRLALYPQVGEGVGMFDVGQDLGVGQEGGQGSVRAEEAAAVPAPAPLEPERSLAKRGGGGPGGLYRSGVGAAAVGSLDDKDAYRQQSQQVKLDQDPSARIQTGPGVPSWSWRTWRLGWSGPVEHTHELELYLLSPGVMAFVSALRIALLALFTFWALRLVWLRARRASPPAASVASAATLFGLTLASLLSTTPARAELPSPELLEQLKQRVQAPPVCEGECVQVPRLAVTVKDGEVLLDAEVHAGERAAYQLPGPVSRWLPAVIELDGRAASALILGVDGYLHVRLEPGRHRVQARGPITGRQLNLDPGTAPRWVSVDAPGWELSGLSESGQIDGSLGLTRPLPVDGAREQDEASSTLPTWALVTRTLSLGVSWAVSTELRRVSPRGAVIVARVPLLPGERVTSAEVPVEGGVASVRLAGDADSVSFESVLEPKRELALKAASDAGYNERWVVRCGPIFRCDARGLAPIQHDQGGRWEPLFAPWPGETLTLDVARPAAATGQIATVDGARLDLHPGARLLRAELDASVRVSAQTTYQLVLPEGSEVDQLSIDGKREPIRQDGAKLDLVLAPGQHQLTIAWQDPRGLDTLFRTPAVRFGPELINAEVSVHLPDERWLLAAGGSGWGPAILFWGHLVLILLLAPLLARLPRSPLSTWQWALLSLGLTQVPLLVAGIVFGWFFVMAFSDFERPERPLWFNARQFLLLGLTLVFLGCLFGAVYDSLLNTPNMEVRGSGSHERLLHWYVDRTPGTLPDAWVLTVSLWVWRFVMLLWALWLANNLVRWLKWAWAIFSSGGVWKAWRRA
jgi:hypothetical protein